MASLIARDGLIQHLRLKGSIIKFCVVETADEHSELRKCLLSVYQDEGLNLLSVNSGLADVSIPENIVKQLAAGFDMGRLIDRFVANAWQQAGYPNKDLVSAGRLAAELGMGLPEVLPAVTSSVRRLLTGSLEEKSAPSFNRDFRNAIQVLATLTIAEGANSPTRAHLIEGFNGWLLGTAPSHVLKMLHVQWKLKRTNATQILRSVLALPALSGVTGSILHLDFRGVTNPEMLKNLPPVNYTKNKKTGTYQWLREVIDQTYLFDSTLIVVEVGPDFLDQTANGPGIGRYDALKFRIMDDVVAGADNPSAVVTRVSA